MKAIWNGVVIAESDKTILLEGHHYFPPGTIHEEYLRRNEHHTTCPWKGQASYFDVVVEGEVNENAACTYFHPKEPAKPIQDHVAFAGGVEVVES
jgi:uncharacterized protein (DUF427 family)